MSRSVVITRAEPGASQTAGRLLALGYGVVKLPALEIISDIPSGARQPSPDQVYIFTSANGVRAVLDAGWQRQSAAICVGPATLTAAQEAGFSDLQNADGNSDDVLNLILSLFAAETAPAFVHVANSAAAGDLCARLGEAGYEARFEALYHAAPVDWQTAAGIWNAHDLSKATLLIHSAKGAEAVIRWIEAGRIDVTSMQVVAVSDRAIQPLAAAGFEKMCVAARPNEDELITALQSVAEPSVSSGS